MISKCILDGYKEEQDPRLAGETAKSACRRQKHNQQARPERKGIIMMCQSRLVPANMKYIKNWLHMHQASI